MLGSDGHLTITLPQDSTIYSRNGQISQTTYQNVEQNQHKPNKSYLHENPEMFREYLKDFPHLYHPSQGRPPRHPEEAPCPPYYTPNTDRNSHHQRLQFLFKISKL